MGEAKADKVERLRADMRRIIWVCGFSCRNPDRCIGDCPTCKATTIATDALEATDG